MSKPQLMLVWLLMWHWIRWQHTATVQLKFECVITQLAGKNQFFFIKIHSSWLIGEKRVVEQWMENLTIMREHDVNGMMKAFRVAWDSNSFQLSPQWPTAKLNFTDEFIQQVSLSCWCSQHIPHLVIVGGCVEAETRDESEWAGHCSFPLVAVETLFKLISHLLSMPLASLSEEWGQTDSFSRWFNLFFLSAGLVGIMSVRPSPLLSLFPLFKSSSRRWHMFSGGRLEFLNGSSRPTFSSCSLWHK